MTVYEAMCKKQTRRAEKQRAVRLTNKQIGQYVKWADEIRRAMVDGTLPR